MRRLLRSPLVLACVITLGPGCPDPEATDDAAVPRVDAFDPATDAARPDAALPDAPGLDAPFDDAFTPSLDAFSDPGGDAPTRTVTYTGTDAIFANPERGFYRAVDLLEESDLSWLHEDHPHDTLVYSYVMLDRFRDREISAATLTAARDAFQVAREDGFEVIVRFAYNLGPYPDADPDAPLARIEGHIAQLAPVLRENEDVIALVQAGFIGAWGEWHTSTNDLDTDPAARRAVVTALLDAVPSSRSTQVRYPPYIADLIGGSPLDASRAWNGSFQARIGFHNDCFVSSDTDVGTYPDDAIDRWKTFIDTHSQFVPVGGETCDPDPPRSECASTIAEMTRHHYSFINRDYHPDIVSGWAAGGCMDDLERRLGYRLALLDASLPERVRPGGSFALRVRLRNEGFAAPFNARPVELVVHDGSMRHAVTLEDVEIRSFLGGREHVIEARVRLPISISAGAHPISIALPSASSALATRAEYAIRFANEGVWDASRGENTLGSMTVDETAPGTTDPGAATLTILE